MKIRLSGLQEIANFTNTSENESKMITRKKLRKKNFKATSENIFSERNLCMTITQPDHMLGVGIGSVWFGNFKKSIWVFLFSSISILINSFFLTYKIPN